MVTKPLYNDWSLSIDFDVGRIYTLYQLRCLIGLSLKKKCRFIDQLYSPLSTRVSACSEASIPQLSSFFGNFVNAVVNVLIIGR